MRHFKRIRLARRWRLTLLAFVLLLLAGSFYNLYLVYQKPQLIPRKVPVYSYYHTGSVDYQVQLKPNTLFGPVAVGPGKTYFARIVDHLNINFSYLFQGDGRAKLKVAYHMVAELVAEKLWTQEFLLVPQTIKYADGNSISFNQGVVIDPQYFSSFEKAIREELGTGGETKVVIKALIAVRADTDKGTVRATLTPSLSFPLTSGSFTVAGDLSPKKSGSLTETRLLPDPDFRQRRMIALVPPALLALSLVLLTLATTGRVEQVTPWQREVRRIRQNYGDLLVNVGKGFALPDRFLVIRLDSIEDLVRVAEELSCPIICPAVQEGEEQAYYVVDGLNAYIYHLAVGEPAARAAGYTSSRDTPAELVE